tara:strand:+ start:576 stop:1430 length:855 start_codon:yes stop_codon:yes gene_type:complete
MFYNPKSESILKDGTILETVPSATKHAHFNFLNECLKEHTTHKGKYLRYTNDDVHCVEEIFSRGTMMCNAIMSRGYSNILFVGHYNDYQSHWVLDKFSDRMVDVMPEERSDMQTFPDLNVISQFIPLVLRAYGYDATFSITRPPESKHTGVVVECYEKFSLQKKSLSCSSQYKHGVSGWTLDADKEEKFDAVVFLGVPMSDPEVGFEEDQVRETFAPYCTPDFEMVDLYYGAAYSNKWQNGESKDFTPHVETSFTARVSWDEYFGGKEDRPEEFDIMDRMFSVY